MKILLLADPEASHTIKWANALADQGIEIFLFGFSRFNTKLYHPGIKLDAAGVPDSIKKQSDGSLSKLVYLKYISKIKKILSEFKPDILHAHYVSSYGLAGALAGFHPFIISVWGSDIYNFPAKSLLHKKAVSFSLNSADRVLSTSHIMAHHTRKHTHSPVEVTPFGINVDKFIPGRTGSVFNDGDLVVGTIKTLESKYGIEYLIRSFKIVKDKNPAVPLKLLLVGSGSLENSLKALTADLGIAKDAIFTGYIPPTEVPRYHNMIDIFVSLSIDDSESFGVAVFEASACGKPVVVSSAGGLKEIVIENQTGLIVPVDNVEKAAAAIEILVKDEALRTKLGLAGREHVIKNYSWNDSVSKMISIYNDIIRAKNAGQ